MCLGYEGENDANIKGGMTIYYTQKDFSTSDLEHYTTAFPPVSRNTAPALRETYLLPCLGFPHDSGQSRDRLPQHHEERSGIHVPPDRSHTWVRDSRLSQEALPCWYHGHPSFPFVLGWQEPRFARPSVAHVLHH
jgi:hypothetical protein